MDPILKLADLEACLTSELQLIKANKFLYCLCYFEPALLFLAPENSELIWNLFPGVGCSEIQAPHSRLL